VLATGFATDFFDTEGELGSGEGLESLQATKQPAPKTVSGARQFAEKTYIPSGLDEKSNDGSSPTRQKIESTPARDSKGGNSVRAIGNNRSSTSKRSISNDDDDGDDDDLSINAAARENEKDRNREREQDPKRYKGIRGFFRRIFD
jgi:hypothetical protein